MATVLVQDGTLSVGDTFIAGPIVGRVRALIDDRGRPTKSAGPSTPVEVLGLTGLPQPGDVFQVAEAAKARQIAAFREEQAKNRALGAKGGRLTLESLQAQIAEGGMKELPIIIKADVQGSAEVLADTLAKLTDEKVKIRIIHSGVGAVNESDVLLGIGFERDHHRASTSGPIETPRRSPNREARRHPAALGDLQRHRRDEEGDDGPARADLQGSADRRRRSPRHLQGAEVRDDRRLHGDGRPHHALGRYPGPAAARQRRDLRRQDRIAAPVQGRRQRSEGRTSSAVSASIGSTTSRSATSSRCSRWSASQYRRRPPCRKVHVPIGSPIRSAASWRRSWRGTFTTPASVS